jgi:hypothetical protein
MGEPVWAIDSRGTEHHDETHAARPIRQHRFQEEVDVRCRRRPIAIGNRNGLVVNTELVPCIGTSERRRSSATAGQFAGDQRLTVGADKGYDTRGFVQETQWRLSGPVVYFVAGLADMAMRYSHPCLRTGTNVTPRKSALFKR